MCSASPHPIPCAVASTIVPQQALEREIDILPSQRARALSLCIRIEIYSIFQSVPLLGDPSEEEHSFTSLALHMEPFTHNNRLALTIDTIDATLDALPHPVFKRGSIRELRHIRDLAIGEFVSDTLHHAKDLVSKKNAVELAKNKLLRPLHQHDVEMDALATDLCRLFKTTLSVLPNDLHPIVAEYLLDISRHQSTVERIYHSIPISPRTVTKHILDTEKRHRNSSDNSKTNHDLVLSRVQGIWEYRAFCCSMERVKQTKPVVKMTSIEKGEQNWFNAQLQSSPFQKMSVLRFKLSPKNFRRLISTTSMIDYLKLPLVVVDQHQHIVYGDQPRIVSDDEDDDDSPTTSDDDSALTL